MKDLRECMALNGGALITPEGCFCTIEHRIEDTPVYKLNVVGTFDIRQNTMNPFGHKRVQKIQSRIENLACYNVEFIALNAHNFKMADPSKWINWDGTNAGKAHDQIYDYMEELVRDYNPENVLVIGCGTGKFVQYLIDNNIKACGIDANPINVLEACKKFLPVENKRVQDLDGKRKFDMVIDPGVMTAAVISPDQVKPCLDAVVNSLDNLGLFVHLPYTRSLLSSQSLREAKLEVLQMTEPKNLFTYDYPKQVYLAEKSN